MSGAIPDWERFEQGCKADAERLRADEAHWAGKPGRGHLRPEFGKPVGRKGRASQVALFDDSPMFGGSDA